MTSNQESTAVNDGAILFANNDSKDDNDPFQNLSNTHSNATAQPKMTPSHSHTTQQSVPSSIATPAKPAAVAPQEESIAGDASSLFGGAPGSGGDTNGLFGTTDSFFSNGPTDQGDSFFSQQQQPQTVAVGHEQQQHYGQGYDAYAYQNTEQQQQGQYDSQKAYGQQQYDSTSYYNYIQTPQQQQQQQQDQYGQYDPYANYQYQQQPQQQQDPYAYQQQPVTSSSTTTQTNTNNSTNAPANTNYYEQSSYDPQQYNNYYANYHQSSSTSVTGASQTQQVESQQQQYSPYDPSAQQQLQQYDPSAQQQQYGQYDQQQYNQQQYDPYSQYTQQHYQQQQPQDDTYSQYQYNYYGGTDQPTGAATVSSEVQSTQQEQYTPFDTGAQAQQSTTAPLPQQQQQQQDSFTPVATETPPAPPKDTTTPATDMSLGQQQQQQQQQQTEQSQQAEGYESLDSNVQAQQQDTYASVDTGLEVQQQQHAEVEGGVQQQEQELQKDPYAPDNATEVDTSQDHHHQQQQQQQQDAFGQYDQYNEYVNYGQTGGASEVQVSQQQEYTGFDTGVQSQQEGYTSFDTGVQSQQEGYTSFDTGIQSQQEGYTSFDTGVQSQQGAYTPFDTGVQSQQEQFTSFETGVTEVQTQAVEEFTPFETGAYQPSSTAAELEIKDHQEQPIVDVQASAPPRQSQEQTRGMDGSLGAIPPPPQQQKVVPPPPTAAAIPPPQKQEEPVAVIQPVQTVPETPAADQVVPSYDPYQPTSYTNNNTYTPDQSTSSAVFTPSKPDEVHAAPATVESTSILGRSSIDQNRAETSTVQSGSMLSRLASPQLDQLLPCPDPACEGENKAKAKFCCECGRPLTSGVSRSVTPIMPSQQPQQPLAMQDTYAPYGQQQQPLVPPPVSQPLGQDMYAPDYSTEPATLMMGEGAATAVETSYYGEAGAATDVYDPQQQLSQQTYPPDPLERAKGCPIVTFGFGGKMCVMFPQTVQRFTSQVGYETVAPITKAMPSAVRITSLKEVIGDQNLTVASLAQFVGPVLNDSKGSTKSKKKEVSTYMDKRIEELTVALPPQENNIGEYNQAHNRIILWRLLKTLTENDGTIGDGDKMDNAVRALVQPVNKGEEDQGNFSVPAYAQADGQPQDEDAENRERSKKVLNKLETYLVNGDRAGAVEYAMQEDLWAHALILSSCVNKDVWKKVVTNFVERELSQTAGETPRQDRFNVTGDKQALRVLYSLFAGSGASSISEFLPTAAPQQRLGTPFGVPPQAVPPQATEEQLQDWQITLTLILANRTPRDTEAITSLGDVLRAHGWLDAAHICYLVSPQSSLHSGIDAPHVRLTLIGAEGTTAFSDLDAYYLTELYEFAVSTKQGGASSLPFLQGYKLVHAWWLADFGFLGEAQRYCEAIANAIKGYTKGSPYLHRQLLENLKEFSELCEAASGQSIGDTKSWVKNKLSKNMLESMWGSFEGKFNKFVSGEDIPPEEPPVRKSTEIMGTPYDAAKDGPPARSASAFDFRNAARSSIGPESLRRAATPTANMASEAYGDRRSSSPGVRGPGPFANAFTPLSHYGESQMQEQPQQEELAQASGEIPSDEQQQAQDNFGYGQPYGGYGYGAQLSNATTSPFGHAGRAHQASNATTSPFGHGGGAAQAANATTSPFGRGGTQQQPQNYYGQDVYNGPSIASSSDQQQNGYGGYDAGGWYGSEQQQQSSEAQQEPAVPATSYEPPTPAASNYEPSNMNDDDLGFGNSSLTKSKPPSADASNENQTQAAAPEPTSQENPTDKPHEADPKKTDEGKAGWSLFSIFSRSSTPSNTPGEKKAVKANLGEESAFYYDEKEKRWVNKNAPSTPAAAPLPPPPKATPSPAPSNRNALSSPPPSSGPPSSIASTPAQRPPTMMRSGSTPPTSTTPPARSATSPPPTASPSGGARRSRKPMRSRYVDVFNQQPGN